MNTFSQETTKILGCICLLTSLVTGCAPSLNLTNPFSESHEWFGNGLPNLIRVSDRLYRGGQPSRQGLRRLKEMGIKTVVNLRSSGGMKDREEEECHKLGLHYEHLRMPAFGHVPEAVVKRFFELVENPDTSPVFIHCLTGTDRVNVLCALYRIRHQHWSAQKAYEEMKRTGFNQLMSQYREYVFNFAAQEHERAEWANGSAPSPHEGGQMPRE